MTNSNHSTSKIPNSILNKKKAGISAIWIIPIVALILGSWLVFKSAFELKAIVEVSFDSASGLEAGKTTVKYRDIVIGKVKTVNLTDDLSKIIAVIEFEGFKQNRLKSSTRFWVVKPRIAIGGVSGLETLLSGNYIEVDLGLGGEPTAKFTGLEAPDIHQLGNPGTRYILRANELGSLYRGSQVKFRGIDVGSVTKYNLADDHSHIEVHIFVRTPHDMQINKNTRFWNISGLQVELNAEGIKLELDSIASLLAGGIAFSTYNSLHQEIPQAKEHTIFELYNSEKPNIEEMLTFRVQLKLYFDQGVEGLSIGAPVEFKGLRIGTVTDIGIEEHIERAEILTFALIDIEPDRLPVTNRTKYKNDKMRRKAIYQYIEGMVNSGLRAQLRSKNLLTGQTLVAMDFFPGLKKVKLKYVDGIPLLPTTPDSIAGILRKVESIVTKIDAMPIEEISNNLDQTMVNINALVKSLNATQGGMMGTQIDETLSELTKAARSIRAMADYLERHPEAILNGKSSQ